MLSQNCNVIFVVDFSLSMMCFSCLFPLLTIILTFAYFTEKYVATEAAFLLSSYCLFVPNSLQSLCNIDSVSTVTLIW